MRGRIPERLRINADVPVIPGMGSSHRVEAEVAKAVGIRACVVEPLIKKEIARAVRKVWDEHSVAALGW